MAVIKNPISIVQNQKEEYEDLILAITAPNEYKQTYVVPYFINSIANNAFYMYGEHGIREYTIEFEENSQLKTIGDYALASSGLVGIDLPEGLLSIGKDGFQSCGLSSITIPSTVTTIGNLAFEFSQYLETVTVLATTPPSLGSDAFFDAPIEWSANAAIYVPAESVNAYKSATNWSTYASKIQAIPSN